jgi:alginate O-acetyltransferase complex protein AlgJ
MLKNTFFENIFNASLFVAIVLFFSIASIFSCLTVTDAVAEKEKRLFAPFPRMRNFRHDINNFAVGFEKYYGDRFAFRLPIVTIKNLLAYEIFHTSGTPLVVVGKQDWLYYTKEGTFDAEINRAPFSPEKVTLWTRMFQSRRDVLAMHHIPYFLVVVPEKGNIYPEYLPSGWARRPGTTRIEQLQNELTTKTKVDFVNAQSILSNSKNADHFLYHTNDTHWNSYGAFLVVQDLLKHISLCRPAVKPFVQSEYRIGKEAFQGNLSLADGLEDWLIDRCISIEPERKNYKTISGTLGAPSHETKIDEATVSEKLPNAYVLHDSYIVGLTPFLSNKFSCAQYHSTQVFKLEEILKKEPDIVIEEIAEHHLYDAEPDNLPVLVTDTTANTKSESIALFGDNLLLKKITAKPTVSGLVVKLFWKAKKSLKRDMKIAIHQLDEEGRSINVYDFKQDECKTQVPSGAEWIDTVEITRCIQPATSSLGILVYDDIFKASLQIKTQKSDWGGVRALFPLAQITVHQ